MPCYDSRNDEDRARNYEAASILCAVIRKHGEQILEGLDYKGLGLSRDKVYAWWAYHKREDEARRKSDAEYKRQTDVKKRAAEKANKLLTLLTPEEISALGIKKFK